MKKCLKISVNCKNAEKAKRNFIQKKAKELGVEGVVQQSQGEGLLVYVCGLFDQVDDFVDSLYVGAPTYVFQDIEVESCASRDYRGVFRVVE
jgi:acylphosphatase